MGPQVLCTPHHRGGCAGACAYSRPQTLTNKAWPRRYFADLIIAYLQDVLALTLLAPARAAAAAPRLPPPMFPRNDGAGAAVCLKGEAFRQSVASMQVRWRFTHARYQEHGEREQPCLEVAPCG